MNLIIIKEKRKPSFSYLLSILFLLMVGDYCLTYLGIHILGAITEGNPMMRGLMELPFYHGIILRGFVCAIPICLIQYSTRFFKNHEGFRYLIVGLLLVQLYPYLLHSIWLYYWFIA